MMGRVQKVHGGSKWQAKAVRKSGRRNGGGQLWGTGRWQGTCVKKVMCGELCNPALRRRNFVLLLHSPELLLSPPSRLATAGGRDRTGMNAHTAYLSYSIDEIVRKGCHIFRVFVGMFEMPRQR